MFYFTDATGQNYGSGSTVIPALGRILRGVDGCHVLNSMGINATWQAQESQMAARAVKVDNYSDYHWISNEERIAGTKTYDSPGSDYREMLTLP